MNQVLDAVFTRKLQPGEFLGTEAQLSEMFQTSRVPIREALSRLEALGVVNLKTGAGGGATIADGDYSRFSTALAVQFKLMGASPEEVFDARIAVETRAAELAAANATKDDIDTLKSLLEKVQTSKSGGRDTIEAILAYHTAIVEASGARTLKLLMQSLWHVLIELYTESSPTAGVAKTYQALPEILQHIENRDETSARRCMHDHLVRQRKVMLTRLKKKTGSSRTKSSDT